MREPAHPRLGWGCLPAAAFAFVFGFPAAFGVMIGECVDESGKVGNCPNERLELVVVALLTAACCALIWWATNRTIRARAGRRGAALTGVAAGFLLAALLLVAAYFLLIRII